jgi:hypothetical protein
LTLPVLLLIWWKINFVSFSSRACSGYLWISGNILKS